MAETEVEILNIDTSKSVRSINNLKGEIKELRERLYGLEQGTEEYNEVLAELGEKQRTVAETTYRISEASTDFSNNITNLTGTMAGMSGVVQTVTGTLSLMGVQMGDDSKMMKTLVAAMSVTTGVQAIQSGYTALRRLTQGLKMATAGTRSLGSAMKSLTLANPFMAALTAITALISAFALLKRKTDEAQEAAKEYQTQLFELSTQATNLTNVADRVQFDADGEKKKQIEDLQDEASKLSVTLIGTVDSMGKQIVAQQSMQAAFRKMFEDAVKSGDKQKQQLIELTAAVWDYRRAAYATLTKYEGEDEAQYQARLKDLEQRETSMLNIYKRQKLAIKERGNASNAAAAQIKADLANIEKIERAAQISLMDDKEGELAKLEDAFREQVKLFEKRGKDIATITQLYEKQRQEIIDKYTRERVQKYIEEAEKEEERAERLSAALLALTEKQIADEQALYDQYSTDVNNRLAANYTTEKVEEAEALMEQAYTALLAKKIELDQQLLQSDQLTEEDRAAVQADLLSLQQEQAERSVEIERKALEKRKKLYENYRKAISSITSSLSSILGSIGETLEQGGNQWKMVKVAEATISTIQGGIAAYMGMVESIPGPAGLIAGAAAAAATVAAGIVEINKIRNTQISTGSSGNSASSTTALGSVKPSAVQVAATQVTNTRQTSTTTDIEELPEQRVYVLESDITNAQNNVKTTVSQATF